MSTLLTPVFFHIVWCALLYALLTITRAPVVCGVGQTKDGSNPFSIIQIFTDNMRLRGMVFTINFVAVLAMWALILIGEVGL